MVALALPRLVMRETARPREVRRLLVVQHLLLGDTLMLTSLLKKARERYPSAEIVMLCPRAYAPLYEKRPYDVSVLPFDPRSLGSHLPLLRATGFDLALIPGDNRWSWLARAMGARWVVAFASEQVSYKDWPVDEFVALPASPIAWGDMAAWLIGGQPPAPYRASEWEAPSCSAYPAPSAPYCVLHLGASSPHKHWQPENWLAIVQWALSQGLEVVLTAGKGEEEVARRVDPGGRCTLFAGVLDLAQMWNLVQHARFLACPDTGIAHLGRLTGTPTVALFGPGSPILFGAGEFWRDSPYRAVWEQDVACRDQTRLFERRIDWVRQCWRSVAECGNPICMHRIQVEAVIGAIRDVLAGRCSSETVERQVHDPIVRR